MLTDSHRIKRRLEAEGWILKRVNGSHHVFKHANRQKNVVLPHPKKDLPLGTVRDIYRDAGWEKD